MTDKRTPDTDAEARTGKRTKQDPDQTTDAGAGTPPATDPGTLTPSPNDTGVDSDSGSKPAAPTPGDPTHGADTSQSVTAPGGGGDGQAPPGSAGGGSSDQKSGGAGDDQKAPTPPAGGSGDQKAGGASGDQKSGTNTGAAQKDSASGNPAAKAPLEQWDDGKPANSEIEKTDDPRPQQQLFEMKRQRALADISKAIEPAAEALWSSDAEKLKAREAIEQSYRKAAHRGSQAEAKGELWIKYSHADRKFREAAADMLRSRTGYMDYDNPAKVESHLSRWLTGFLTGNPDAPPNITANVDAAQTVEAKAEAAKAEAAAKAAAVAAAKDDQDVGDADADDDAQAVAQAKAALQNQFTRLRAILRERSQVTARWTSRLGDREQARQVAADTTKKWEKAFASWSAPEKEIAALIASYYDRIDKLNADINTGNNRIQAIFSFWFEVAPLHLQLRDQPVTDQNAPGVERVREALKDFGDVADKLKAGSDRKDGSLYLLDPDDGKGGSPITEKRQSVLSSWQEAAKVQADAEAAYLIRPDAAADLKPRYDKLKDDGWIATARDALAAPKA